MSINIEGDTADVSPSVCRMQGYFLYLKDGKDISKPYGLNGKGIKELVRHFAAESAGISGLAIGANGTIAIKTKDLIHSQTLYLQNLTISYPHNVTHKCIIAVQRTEEHRWLNAYLSSPVGN